MSVDWRTGPAQRAAVAKRRELETLNDAIARLDILHAEALAFDGEYRARLQAITNRLHEVGPQIGIRSMSPQRWPTPEDIAERRRLEDERSDVEREWHAARAARTTRTTDGLRVQDSCELNPDDVAKRRIWAIRCRDGASSDLAEIEARLSPGELVQSGVTAPAYAEHRERVDALRARLG